MAAEDGSKAEKSSAPLDQLELQGGNKTLLSARGFSSSKPACQAGDRRRSCATAAQASSSGVLSSPAVRELPQLPGPALGARNGPPPAHGPTRLQRLQEACAACSAQSGSWLSWPSRQSLRREAHSSAAGAPQPG